MKVLVVGAAGQLGSELCEYLLKEDHYDIFQYDKETMDITDLSATMTVVKEITPNVIINCAAYTNVDGAETDYETAYKINVLGCENLAKASVAVKAKLIHISTDFVFDGEKTNPYFEYDATGPMSVYGQTKLAGEWAIRHEMSRFFIIRTSWLYGKNGNNFVKTMIRLGKEHDEISVVNDQIGSPTCVSDLILVIEKCLSSKAYGVYHFSNAGACSWYDFAKEIFNQMDMQIKVNPTTSNEFIRLARRPSYSVMNTKLVTSALGIEPREWQVALKECLSQHRNKFE
jgi:dTDP-4-dehydrorhamnose reductase